MKNVKFEVAYNGPLYLFIDENYVIIITAI